MRGYVIYDVRPLALPVGLDDHTETDAARIRLDEVVMHLATVAEKARGEIDWTTLRITVERHTHTGEPVVRSSARLR